MRGLNWISNKLGFFGCFIVGGIVGALICSIAPHFIWTFITHPVTASWAQAFGTIAAVFSGFWLNAHQKKSAACHKVNLIASALDEADRQLRSYTICTSKKSGSGGSIFESDGAFDPERLSFAVQYLSSIGFSNFPFNIACSLNEALNIISKKIARYNEEVTKVGENDWSIMALGGPDSPETKAIKQAIQAIERQKKGL